jgi:hypothetical protein
MWIGLCLDLSQALSIGNIRLANPMNGWNYVCVGL